MKKMKTNRSPFSNVVLGSKMEKTDNERSMTGVLESGYHSFFPFSIANQKSNNEKLTGYFVCHYNTKNEKCEKSPITICFFIFHFCAQIKNTKWKNGHQDRI